MNKLSSGADSTLGNWHGLCRIFFGADSPATKFIEAKIAAAPNGEHEEVLADESQMLVMLARAAGLSPGTPPPEPPP